MRLVENTSMSSDVTIQMGLDHLYIHTSSIRYLANPRIKSDDIWEKFRPFLTPSSNLPWLSSQGITGNDIIPWTDAAHVNIIFWFMHNFITINIQIVTTGITYIGNYNTHMGWYDE